MRVTVEKYTPRWLPTGREWAISSEKHDGIIYLADSAEEAVKKYEQDRHVKVTEFEVR